MQLSRYRFPLVPELLVVLEELVIVGVGPFSLFQARVELVKISLPALLRAFLKSKPLQLDRHRVPVHVFSVAFEFH